MLKDYYIHLNDYSDKSDDVRKILGIVHVYTDANNFDTEEDGVKDGMEVKNFGSNPLLSDSDDDGLDDSQESFHGTNPTDRDTDDDHINDYYEVYITRTVPTMKDSDKDGLWDWDECPGAYVKKYNYLELEVPYTLWFEAEQEIRYNYSKHIVRDVKASGDRFTPCRAVEITSGERIEMKDCKIKGGTYQIYIRCKGQENTYVYVDVSYLPKGGYQYLPLRTRTVGLTDEYRWYLIPSFGFSDDGMCAISFRAVDETGQKKIWIDEYVIVRIDCMGKYTWQIESRQMTDPNEDDTDKDEILDGDEVFWNKNRETPSSWVIWFDAEDKRYYNKAVKSDCAYIDDTESFNGRTILLKEGYNGNPLRR